MKTRLTTAAVLLLGAVLLPWVVEACDESWNENALGTASAPPTIACASSVTVTIPAAFAPPIASGGSTVTLGGTATGCSVLGVSLYGSVPASSVGSSYWEWTATVPLTTVESQEAGACGPGTLAVPIQVLVTEVDGGNAWVSADAGCVPLKGDLGCNPSSGLAVTGAYAAPTSSAPSLTVTGTLDASDCPVSALTLLSAYPASSVGSNFSAWTATVPLAALNEQMPCTFDQGGQAIPGFGASAQIFVPGLTGLSVIVNVPDAGCVPAATVPLGACATAYATVAPTSYALDGGLLSVTGTVDAGACTISGVIVMGTTSAMAVVPNFALWSATVPLSLTSPSSCAGSSDIRSWSKMAFL